ncbi:acetyltransferase domain-containing protein [Xylariaceae sp. FL1651]|nr:acetyltransferase domain-containing protein [Xylariaceae sp. FL1651]
MASPGVPAPPHPCPHTSSKIKVKTTWPSQPLLPNSERKPIRTDRLLLRPFTDSDAEAIFEMRKQPEVMLWTSVGVPDKDIEASRSFVERFTPPNDAQTYDFAIVYMEGNNEAKEGIVIGSGGAHKVDLQLGWPEVGYMLRKEYWNKGLATEFMRAWTQAWWALPRSEVEIEVPVDSVLAVLKTGAEKTGPVIQVPERLTAIIDANNTGSRRVLQKIGFAEYREWNEPDSRAEFEGNDVTLVGFMLEAPES